MDAKEKAKGLVRRFWDEIKSPTTGTFAKNKKAKTKMYMQAKQCAVVCVDEIISSWEDWDDWEVENLKQVKAEISNL